MGGRAVEGTGLENRQTGNRLVGSNPTPSASRWTRDLSAEIRARLRAGPIGKATQSDTAKHPSDVDAAVATNILVIRRHRRILERGAALAEMIIGEIEEATLNKAVVPRECPSMHASQAKPDAAGDRVEAPW